MPNDDFHRDSVPRTIVIRPVTVANHLFQRLLGLMGRQTLTERDTLFFPRCRAIHTCFMCVEMDAVFVDRTLSVVQVLPKVKPFRFPPPVWEAWGVLELASGTSHALNIRVGDQLRLEDSSSRSLRW